MEHRPKKRLPLIRILIICVAAAVFVYSGWQLYDYWSENNSNDRENQKLIRQAVTILTPTEPAVVSEDEPDATDETQGPTFPAISYTIPIQVDFEVLHSENPDIIAWIYSEGTPINYPVAQSGDNEYYLRRLTDGSYNYGGTIFADFRNASDLSDLNTLIYGHNMNNDSMFGTLLDYHHQSYYEEHPHLWILTPERAYRVDPVAGFVTESDSDTYTLFDSAEDLQGYLEGAVERSTFAAADLDLAGVERIVTLSTCSYEYTTARYVVVGSLIPVEYPH